MEHGLNEAFALFQASVRKSPALMMETVSVDANRGVTSRGNSPYDKFASPATRAKVLESRLQEIEAFARNRGIPTSNVYAAAEAAMRTGKIPDLGQYGLAGDDAVALKQFLISDILNIAGLEWTDYKGDPVEELAPPAEEHGEDPVSAVLRDSGLDPSSFMAESIKGKPAHGLTSKQTRRYTGRERGASDMWRKAKAMDATADIAKRQQLGRDRRPLGGSGMGPVESGVKVDPSRYMSEVESTDALASAARLAASREQAAAKPAVVDPRIAAAAARAKKAAQELNRRGLGLGAIKKGGPPPRRQLQMNDTQFDPASFMAEEGPIGGPQSTSVSPGRMSPGNEADIANPQSYMKHDLLPKAVMAKLKQTVGDGVYGYSREDLFRLAREHGLLGTEEWVQEEVENAESRLKARREAQRISREQEKKRKEGKGDPLKAQIARAHATGQGNLAKNVAKAGNTIQGTLAKQDVESQIGKAAQGSNIRRTQRIKQQQLGDFQQRFGAVVSLQRTGAAALRSSAESNEPVLMEHDYCAEAKRHGGKFVKYIQGNIGIYEFDSSADAQQFAGTYSTKTTATPKVHGNTVFIDESTLGESHLGYGGNDRSAGSAGLSNYPGPTEPPYGNEETDKAEKKAKEKEVKEDTRSITDKILGIVDGDPRGESWPKLGGEMARLMNLENCGVFRGPRGFSMPEETPQPIEEMSISAGMGGFIGGGMMSGMTGRTVAMPSYDDSYDLPEDPEKRIALLKKMLDKHGLKKPVEGE